MNDGPAIVTGVPGWLGTRFVQTLLEGMPELPKLVLARERRVSILTVNPKFTASQLQSYNQVRLVHGDVCEPSSLTPLFDEARGGTVFHIAGVVHPQRGIKELFAVNARGTDNMIQAALRAGVRRFVFISSNSPVGCNANANERFDESAPYKPYLNYGKSKCVAEQVVRAAAGNIEIVILRPPWFYGPGQPPRQTLFFKMIRQGKFPLVGDGLNMRSMAYIDNICQAMHLADQQDQAQGETYWIADRQPYTMRQIIDTVEELLEHEFGLAVAHKRFRLPFIASEAAYLVDLALQSCGLYHQKVHVLSEMNKTIACQIDKAERELGYAPSVALKEGMRRSIRWVLDQGIGL